MCGHSATVLQYCGATFYQHQHFSFNQICSILILMFPSCFSGPGWQVNFLVCLTCKISPREDNNEQYCDEYFHCHSVVQTQPQPGRARGSKELSGRSDRFDYFSFWEFHVTDWLAGFISVQKVYRRYFANYVIKLKKKIIFILR